MGGTTEAHVREGALNRDYAQNTLIFTRVIDLTLLTYESAK